MKQNAILGIICGIIVIAINLPEIVITLKKGERTQKFNEWMLAIGIWLLIFGLVQLFIY